MPAPSVLLGSEEDLPTVPSSVCTIIDKHHIDMASVPITVTSSRKFDCRNTLLQTHGTGGSKFRISPNDQIQPVWFHPQPLHSPGFSVSGSFENPPIGSQRAGSSIPSERKKSCAFDLIWTAEPFGLSAGK